MSDKVTAPKIRAMKERSEPVVCITAYDFTFAQIMDRAGVDLILVGDSLGNVMLGYDTTLPVTLDTMIHHTAAVRRGVSRAMIVADMPFGSYQSSVSQAVDSAVALMRAGAEGVKLEGPYLDEAEAIVRAGIPVMAHLGMTPQSVYKFGGYRVQGRGDSAKGLIADAKALEEAGAFSLVLELVPRAVAAQVTRAVSIPTIGIGAGVGCDGQIQVMHDVLGLSDAEFKHARRFCEGQKVCGDAVAAYAKAVRGRSFPTDENSV